MCHCADHWSAIDDGVTAGMSAENLISAGFSAISGDSGKISEVFVKCGKESCTFFAKKAGVNQLAPEFK